MTASLVLGTSNYWKAVDWSGRHSFGRRLDSSHLSAGFMISLSDAGSCASRSDRYRSKKPSRCSWCCSDSMCWSPGSHFSMMWNGEELGLEPLSLVLGVWRQRAVSESICSESFGCCSEPRPSVIPSPATTELSHTTAYLASPPDYAASPSPLFDSHSPIHTTATYNSSWSRPSYSTAAEGPDSIDSSAASYSSSLGTTRSSCSGNWYSSDESAISSYISSCWSSLDFERSHPLTLSWDWSLTRLVCCGIWRRFSCRHLDYQHHHQNCHLAVCTYRTSEDAPFEVDWMPSATSEAISSSPFHRPQHPCSAVPIDWICWTSYSILALFSGCSGPVMKCSYFGCSGLNLFEHWNSSYLATTSAWCSSWFVPSILLDLLASAIQNWIISDWGSWPCRLRSSLSVEYDLVLSRYLMFCWRLWSSWSTNSSASWSFWSLASSSSVYLADQFDWHFQWYCLLPLTADSWSMHFDAGASSGCLNSWALRIWGGPGCLERWVISACRCQPGWKADVHRISYWSRTSLLEHSGRLVLSCLLFSWWETAKREQGQPCRIESSSWAISVSTSSLDLDFCSIWCLLSSVVLNSLRETIFAYLASSHALILPSLIQQVLHLLASIEYWFHHPTPTTTNPWNWNAWSHVHLIHPQLTSPWPQNSSCHSPGVRSLRSLLLPGFLPSMAWSPSSNDSSRFDDNWCCHSLLRSRVEWSSNLPPVLHLLGSWSELENGASGNSWSRALRGGIHLAVILYLLPGLGRATFPIVPFWTFCRFLLWMFCDHFSSLRLRLSYYLRISAQYQHKNMKQSTKWSSPASRPCWVHVSYRHVGSSPLCSKAANAWHYLYWGWKSNHLLLQSPTRSWHYFSIWSSSDCLSWSHWRSSKICLPSYFGSNCSVNPASCSLSLWGRTWLELPHQRILFGNLRCFCAKARLVAAFGPQVNQDRRINSSSIENSPSPLRHSDQFQAPYFHFEM